MGRVVGLFGVRGWVKVFSHTQVREAIADYDPIFLHIGGDWRPAVFAEAQQHGKGLIVRFAGYDERAAAAVLVGCDIGVRRGQLPEPEAGEYYWADLEGLRVTTLEGIDLGTVERLFDTGANDVLVVRGERERLIPFVKDTVVIDINLRDGAMQVDWDPTF